MLVFKFGGASVKNPDAIRNIAEILTSYQDHKLVIVVSAMGKTTNKLEDIINSWNKGDKSICSSLIESLRVFHLSIAEELNPATKHFLLDEIQSLFLYLEKQLHVLEGSHLQQYDAVVSVGELLSTKIIAAHLNDRFNNLAWIDAREFIKTDAAHTEARINWELTGHKISQLNSQGINWMMTQGFIGSSGEGFTTTLGREGSDFTAAIFAYCLGASECVIWKDVPGILNADPKLNPGAKLITNLSYDQAAEMTYYGAKVIHPKTMRPLAWSGIPLRVRSFQETAKLGTLISQEYRSDTPAAMIYNFDQTLISFRKREFTFVDEKMLSLIFHSLDSLNIKINLMQNSATQFSVSIDSNGRKTQGLINALQDQFEIHYNQGLSLLTVNNHQEGNIPHIDGEIILRQETRKTIQVLYLPRH